MDNLQLEINFSERRNRFRDALNAGEFVLLVENSSPGRDNDPAASADRLAALENAVLDIKGINASLAITDRCHTVDVWRAAEYASALSAENRDRHVIYLSGRDTTLNETRNLIEDEEQPADQVEKQHDRRVQQLPGLRVSDRDRTGDQNRDGRHVAPADSRRKQRNQSDDVADGHRN